MQWCRSTAPPPPPATRGPPTSSRYFRVKVEVSWPGLGDRPPVTMCTIMTPPQGHLLRPQRPHRRQGHRRRRSAARGGAGRARSPSRRQRRRHPHRQHRRRRLRAALRLVAGTYTVTREPARLRRPRRRPDRDPQRERAEQAAVARHRRVRPGGHDQRHAPAHQPGLRLPPATSVPITVGNSGLTPSGTKTITGTGATRALTDLWPFPSGYQVWAGGCLANDPGDDVGPARCRAPPGGVESAVVPMAPVRVAAPGGHRPSPPARTPTPAAPPAPPSTSGSCPRAASSAPASRTARGSCRAPAAAPPPT